MEVSNKRERKEKAYLMLLVTAPKLNSGISVAKPGLGKQ
jgi:hypothetical protein